MVHTRRDFTLVPQRLGCPDQTQAGTDDHDVAGAEVLLRTVIDRPHALRDRLVLEDDARQTRVAFASLYFLAVEQVVIAGVGLRSGAAIPIGRVRQHLSHAEAGALAAATPCVHVLPLAALREDRDPTGRCSTDAEKHGVLVIHGHPGPEAAVHHQRAWWDLGIEREEEVGEAPVVRVLFGRTVSAVAGPKFCIGDGVAWGSLLNLVMQEVALVGILQGQVAHVQEGKVHGIDVALERLHIVAVTDHGGDATLGIHIGLEVREWRRCLARPHVRPNDATTLHARIRDGPYLVLKIALGRLAGHVNAGARHIELPAVVYAAQALCLIPAIEERGAPMRAAIGDQAHLAGGNAESDEALTQQAYAQGWTVWRRQLVCTGGWNPVLAHEITHRRPGTDATQQLIVLFAQHEKSSLASLSEMTSTHRLVQGLSEGRRLAFRTCPELFPQPSCQRCQFILYIAQLPLYLMRSLYAQVAFVA